VGSPGAGSIIGSTVRLFFLSSSALTRQPPQPRSQ
jgi:hypothetical protein